ncbi:hypothetical protein KZ813_09525 [Sphingomonas sp. RHCKR7]|uniref:hypothetical protein n=1 Tax=Sphingomonas folli TaxID=2862497 RepID=UPI001CA59906|nr:hypothetical protein [Sphingomonas folli]MBW6527076.1 hypothetical protein [Sphingomonas folli]
MKTHCLLLVGTGSDPPAVPGWQVGVRCPASLPALDEIDVALVAVGGGTVSPSALRARPGASCLPIIALAPVDWIEREDWRALGYDGAVAADASPAAMADALADWHRAGTLATLDRLESSFGAAEIESLLGRFGVMLAAVRAERDPTALAGMAHRVAGIAGTLGFAALGRLWLRFSEGESGLAGSARRAAAYAITTIARRG